jgi:Ca2+/H+ antiporter
MWIALYDMLLEWIDPEQMHLHQAEAPTPTSMRTPRAMVSVYADNLVTLTCDHAAFYWQQRQADWLSAFCAFSGLQLHSDKIVAIELGKKCPRRVVHIIVHGNSWNKISCQIVRCDSGNLEKHDNINLKFVK